MKEKPLKIAVVGEIRSGKDTVCNLIREQSGKYPYPLYFAEGIEMIIKKFFPEAFAGGQKPRKHYQEIGQHLRTLNPEVWINHTKRVYRRAKRLGFKDFFVTDLRKVNEYEWLKSEGFTVIKVESEPEIRIARMKASGDQFDMNALLHSAEQEISLVPYDYLITNNTTLEDLTVQVDNVLKDMKVGADEWV